MARRGDAIIDLSPGSLDARQRNAVVASLARSELAPPETSRHQGSSHLSQQTFRQQGNLEIYSLDRLEGDAEPFVAYRPENLIARSRHDGVAPGNRQLVLTHGSHHLTYRWTFPDLGNVIAVTVGHPTDPDSRPVYDDISVIAGRTGVVLEILVDVGTAGSAGGEVFTLTGQFLLDGQVVMALDTTANPVLRDEFGNIRNTAIWPVIPIFEHPASGEFTLESQIDDAEPYSERYIQRALVWEQPWPSFPDHPLDTPVLIENRFGWDLGPALTPEDAPRWRAGAPGASFPPTNPDGTPAYSTGGEVSFTYDPELLDISARGADAPRTFTLVPEMDSEYATQEAYRQAVQARECQTLFSYFVEGQAISYDSLPTLRATTVRTGEFSNGGLVPARIRQLYADNSRFEPDRIQVGQSTTFKADVVSCLFEDPQIFWTLTVEGERLVDPEDPEGDVETFLAFTAGTEDWQDFGPDFALQAAWNGLLPDGSTAPAGTYTANLEVKVRERTRVDRDGNPIELTANGTAQVQLFGQRLEIHDFLATPPSVDPATVEDVRFTATAVPIDFVDSPDIAWHFRFLNPEGTEVVSTDIGFGPGQAFDFFLDTHPGGQALPAGVYTAELRAEAVSPSAPTPVWSELATVSITVGGAEPTVEIQNLILDPNPLVFEDQEPGSEGGFFQADLIPKGYESPPTLGWTLEIKSASTAVRTLTGVVTLDRSPTPFTAFWDGRDDSSALVEEGSYEGVLTIDTCVAPAPGPGQGLGGSFGSGAGESDESAPEPCDNRESETVAVEVGSLVRVRFEDEVIPPSFLFHVSKEVLEPPPRHGAIPGTDPDGRPLDGSPSTTNIVIKARKRIEQPLILRVKGIDFTGGHQENVPRPAGAVPVGNTRITTSKDLRDYLEARPAETVVQINPPIEFGEHRFTYVAPFASGTYVASASLKDSSQVLSDDQVQVRVSGLEHVSGAFQAGELGGIDSPGQGIAALFGQTSVHVENHYGRPDFNRDLAGVCREYQRQLRRYYGPNLEKLPGVPFSPGLPLRYDPRVFINDMSLPQGGYFGLRPEGFPSGVY
ncbi:MAG: hypothetical protein AB1758_02335, partial [Candidatus Eremiobacterota bacterium]